MAIQIAQFLLALSLLIVLHELGHFIPAKLFKTRVEKFFLFFDAWGKKLISYTHKGTTYGIGWIPLGGYVKISGMVDESMDTENLGKEPEDWEFRAKPAWQRLIILSGGVIVNFILGYFIYAMIIFAYGIEYLPTSNLKYGVWTNEIGKSIGIQTGDKIISVNGNEVKDLNEAKREFILGADGELVLDRNGQNVEIPITDSVVGLAINNQQEFANIFNPRLVYEAGGFSKESTAKAAGMEEGDSIVQFNGHSMIFFDQYLDSIPKYAGKPIELGLYRGNEFKTLTVTVSDSGRIGVGNADNLRETYDIAYDEYSLSASFGEAFNQTGDRLSSYVRQFQKLIFKPETGAYKHVGGFYTMLKQYPTTWNWRAFWELTAFISLMLGFLNILPIPALDGGHIVFVLIEMVSGRRPSIKVLEVAQTIGFVLLLALLVFANGNDLIKAISG
jgi:regulator of sigma E protease